MAEILARFPEKFRFLFDPHPYKVAYGGRFGLKSWSFSRALAIMGAQRKLRILCTREVQKSIKDSVHQLLCDQISALGLSSVYDPISTEIRGANGTQFLFAGLSDLTAESIKSFEGIDIVWVEEARAVSKRSWGILIPTIRKSGSEIWASFNPELSTDDTFQRFVVKPPPGAVVVKTTYRDADELGVFPERMEAERAHLQATDPEEYDCVWEGNCRPAVAGAIYAKELSLLEQEGHVCNLPYDPKFKVHVVADLGFNDSMAIGLYQRHLSELRCIGYIEDSGRTIDSYSAELRALQMNWGKFWVPHDAKHETLAAAGVSVEQLLRKLGWDVASVPNIGVEAGIKQTRMVLKRTYFDETKTVRLRECLKRYRRGIPATTGEPGAPIHDEFSHGADMERYASIVAEKMTNEDRLRGDPIRYDNRGIV